ncbi:MAG: hypothetical protein ACRCXE_01475, partial [Metamycoplasmataceae bacterium]
MTKNLKRLALGVMATGAIAIPLAVAVSCGSEEKDVNYEITKKASPVITKADIDNNKFKELATLEKLFEGITADNLKNITVSLNPVNSNDQSLNYTVTLKANKGYTIDGKETLVSNQFAIPVVNLVIEKISPAPTDIKLIDIEGEKFKDFSVLSKLFNGTDFSEANMAHVNIELIPIAVDVVYTIKLTPLTGYTINGQVEGVTSEQFDLEVNLAITVIDITQYILADDVAGANRSSLATLAKLFNLDPTIVQTMVGINFTVEMNDLPEGKHTFTLKPLSGNKINGSSNPLVSKEFMIQQILTGVNSRQPSQAQLDGLTEADITTGIESSRTLRIFFVINPTTQIPFVTALLNDINGDGSLYSITITANDGFLFPNN